MSDIYHIQQTLWPVRERDGGGVMKIVKQYAQECKVLSINRASIFLYTPYTLHINGYKVWKGVIYRKGGVVSVYTCTGMSLVF